MGRKNKEVEAMPTCYRLTFMCCQPCLPNFQVVYHEHPFAFSPASLSCRSLKNVSFGGCILGLINSVYHGWLSMMTSSEGTLFSLASGPPNPKPITVHITFNHSMCKR